MLQLDLQKIATFDMTSDSATPNKQRKEHRCDKSVNNVKY